MEVLIPSVLLVGVIVGLIYFASRKPTVKPDPNYIDPIEVDNVKFKMELVKEYNRIAADHNKLETRYWIIKDKDSIQAQGMAGRLFQKADLLEQARKRLKENGIRPL